MRHRALIPLFVLSLVPAALHGEPPAKPAASPFLAMDADHDGQVTRAEWKGNDVGFAMFDADGDCVLSGAELAPAAQPEAPAAAFARQDRDHDGSLTREEWTGSSDDFDRLDRNHDGKVSRDELLDRRRDRARLEGIFRRLDKNRDGRLARSEWDGANFDRLDRDHDGFISREELLRR